MVKTNKITNLNTIKNKIKDSSKVSALSPREIVSELDRYVIGQKEAKKAVGNNDMLDQIVKSECQTDAPINSIIC